MGRAHKKTGKLAKPKQKKPLPPPIDPKNFTKIFEDFAAERGDNSEIARSFIEALSGPMAEVGRQEEALMKRLKKLDLEPFLDEDSKPSESPTNYVREILNLARRVLVAQVDAGVQHYDRVCFLHPDIRPRIREIGERLWEMTKNSDPGFIMWFYSCDLLSLPRWTRSELNEVWEGIEGVKH